MNPYLRVVLCGFSDFEQRTLASVVRLAGSGAGRYVQVAEIADADLVVANADTPAVVAAVMAGARESDTVFIGKPLPDGSVTRLRRPIDALQVLRELDRLRERRKVEAAAFARVVDARPATRTLAQPPAQTATHRAAQVPTPKRERTQGPGGSGAETARIATLAAIATTADEPAPTANTTTLIVDNSPVATRSLHLSLKRLGANIVTAGDSEEALELLSRMPFDWVFVNVDLGDAGGVGGLALCQQIKSLPLRPAATAPTVLMVSAQPSALLRVRATFAGCDHLLAMPVDDEVLRNLLVPPPPKAFARPRRPAASAPQSGGHAGDPMPIKA